MRSPIAACAVALCIVAGCTGESPMPGPGTVGSFTTTTGESGFTSGSFGTTSAGQTTSGDGTLDGDLAFPVANASAENAGLSTMSIALGDSSFPGCGSSSDTRTLRIDFELDQGAGPGRYDLDGGVAVTLHDDTASPTQTIATASDGTVYLFEVDDGAVRGNLDVTFTVSDGGAPSALHGNFNAVPCN